MAAESLDHLLRLALTQQPVVHEDAGQTVADGAMHERGGDGAVHAAAQAADHAALFAYLAADAGYGVVDETARRPVPHAAADVLDEVFEDDPPLRRVDDLGMELEAVEAARFIGDGCQGRVHAVGDGDEAGGQSLHAISVAHPRLEAVRQTGQQRAGKRPPAPTADRRRAVSRSRAGATCPPRVCARSWRP